MHNICFNCGYYGHPKKGCPQITTAGREHKGIAMPHTEGNLASTLTQSSSKENSSSSGDWMITQKDRQRRSTAATKGNSGIIGKQSCGGFNGPNRGKSSQGVEKSLPINGGRDPAAKFWGSQFSALIDEDHLGGGEVW